MIKKINTVFDTIEDLKNIPASFKEKQKKKLTYYIEELTKQEKLLKENQKKFNTIDNKILNFPSLKNEIDYTNKKLLIKKMIDIENVIIIIKSNFSKYINKLITAYLDHFNKTNHLSNLEKIHQFISLQENKKFKDNYYPKKRLKKILEINKFLKTEEFQLEVAEAIINSNFTLNLGLKLKKPKIIWKKIGTLLKKRITYHKEMYINLTESYQNKKYAKLIKKLDKLVSKENKKTNFNNQTTSAYIIDFENLNKYYYNKWIANKILSDINIKIKPGEFVIILGPSGCGKTTLLNIMSGMDKATYGKTIVANNNLINLNENELTNFRKKNIGYIFQQYGLLPNLNVKENVEIGANLQSNKSKRLNIDELLKLVGMAEHSHKFPYELSGGQQQRVAIARSMAKNPHIIFADEPTGAVSEEMAKQILQLFVDFNKKYKTTIVIVTHNQIFADLATKVIKIKEGKATEINNKKPKKVEELDWTN